MLFFRSTTRILSIIFERFQLLAINDDSYVSLMDLDTCDTKDDLKLPEGALGDEIKAAFEKDESSILVRYLKALLKQTPGVLPPKWLIFNVSLKKSKQ